ncbi:MAG: hypothetical protein ABID09_04375 [Candidatus Omnitrophota bacterium]
MKSCIKKVVFFIGRNSLEKAAGEQGLSSLAAKLKEIVPDITNQYTMFTLDTEFLRIKARNTHAFQISLVDKVMREFQKASIVDIGDSAGTHLQYIMGLYSKEKDINVLSVNMDPEAVERIKARGLTAINARAEDINDHNINADLFLCFEILEHLADPAGFLHKLSSKTDAKRLIITVPYLRKSRVGLHHIRGHHKDVINAENTHIFELCPEDWKLIVKHAGWKIVDESVYLQYPKRGLLWVTKPLWKKFDFEGFYGMVLKKDNTWSSKYSDWRKGHDE